MMCGKLRVAVLRAYFTWARARKGDPMNAVVFHGIGDIRLEKVKDPALKQPGDAIVKLSASAICGTDFVWFAARWARWQQEPFWGMRV